MQIVGLDILLFMKLESLEFPPKAYACKRAVKYCTNGAETERESTQKASEVVIGMSTLRFGDFLLG
jgi:hypothetical protein